MKDFMPDGGGTLGGAVKAYADAVRGGTFPTLEHGYD